MILISFQTRGEVNPLLTLTTKSLTEDKNINLQLTEKQHSYVVIFLSSTCPCSNSHINHLKELQTQFPQFYFLGVHSNKDEALDNVIAYFKTASLNFPIIQDQNNKLLDSFKALRTPHAFVMNKEGAILFKGGVSDSSLSEKATTFYLKDALTDLSNGHKVKVSQSRVLGCEITR